MAHHDFLESGFQFFPQLLSTATIAIAREEVGRLCDQARRGELESAFPLSGLKPHRNPGITSEELGNEPFLLPMLGATSPRFADILLQENLWHIAAEVLQTSDVIYHFSNITRKPPRIGPNLSWHRDYPNQYLCPRNSRHCFRLLIALDPMDLENGCTLALPGTHLVPDQTAIEEDTRKGFSTENSIALAASAGDAFAIDSKLIHGGLENRSSRERNLLVIQFGTKTDDYLYWAEERFTGLTLSEIQKSLHSLDR